MTFDQYIQNPMGVSNAVIHGREMYRNMYSEKLNLILVREAGKINYNCYKTKDKYYVYIKVPSELVPEFYYDVLVEFTPPKDKKIRDSKTVREYDARFYSNDPSFVFTFAHAFIDHDMFIKQYKDKMSKQAIKEKAKAKNALNIVGYVKSLYFAYLIMSKYGLFNKIKYIEKYNEKFVKSMIMHADQKIALRQEAGQTENKKARQKAREEKRKIEQNKQDLVQPGMIKKTNNIRKTNVIGKSNNRVKTTKKVGKR